jgi:hypothetical protein
MNAETAAQAVVESRYRGLHYLLSPRRSQVSTLVLPLSRF